jgi:hypothetical protein
VAFAGQVIHLDVGQLRHDMQPMTPAATTRSGIAAAQASV